MAKKIKDPNREPRAWREGELIEAFQLESITTFQTPLMQAWLNTTPPDLDALEQRFFDRLLVKVQRSIAGWNEEDLKMKFITYILELGHITDDNQLIGYFDKTISATVDSIPLVVKSDFMFARGVLDVFKTPYFHFQEYKPYKNPSGDSMAQLLEAFLIAQVKNENGKPMYGVDIIGANWRFVTMEGRQYCISKPFVAVDKDDLLKIIAILRQFRRILNEQLRF